MSYTFKFSTQMKLQRVIGLLFFIFLNVAANMEETKSQIIQLVLSYIKGVHAAVEIEHG